jgi:hypothetical protein
MGHLENMRQCWKKILILIFWTFHIYSTVFFFLNVDDFLNIFAAYYLDPVPQF